MNREVQLAKNAYHAPVELTAMETNIPQLRDSIFGHLTQSGPQWKYPNTFYVITGVLETLAEVSQNSAGLNH
jgi:hypothetical protein